MINIEINIKKKSAVYGFGIRPVSRLRGTSLSIGTFTSLDTCPFLNNEIQKC